MEILEILFLGCFLIQMLICVYVINIYFKCMRISKGKDYFNYLTRFKIYESDDICSNDDSDDEIREKLKDLSSDMLFLKKEKMIAALFLEKEIVGQILKKDLDSFIEAMKREEKILFMILDEIEARSGSDDDEKNKKKQKNIRNFY